MTIKDMVADYRGSGAHLDTTGPPKPRWRLLTGLPIRLLVFAIVTGLMLVSGVISYHPGLVGGAELRRLPVGALTYWLLSSTWRPLSQSSPRSWICL